MGNSTFPGTFCEHHVSKIICLNICETMALETSYSITFGFTVTTYDSITGFLEFRRLKFGLGEDFPAKCAIKQQI